MPKPPRPSASEVLRHNLLILIGLPSLNCLIRVRRDLSYLRGLVNQVSYSMTLLKIIALSSQGHTMAITYGLSKFARVAYLLSDIQGT